MRLLRSAAAAAIVVALVLSVGGAGAAPPDGLDTRIFDIRFKSVEDVVLLIEPYIGQKGSYMVQPRLKAITVRDEASRLERIAEVIAEFDQPPRSVRLAIELLDAVKASPTDGRRGESGTGVDSILSGVTQWTDYALIGSGSIIGVEGANSNFTLGERYRVRFDVGTVADRQGVVKFDRFALDRIVREQDGGVKYAPLWDTSLNLRDGQRLMIGITKSQESARALFLVITATLEPSGPVGGQGGR